ncbi:MAG: TRAP transporter substrate-binding protein [Gammaproteobacteria bacterium]|nr:TRAP transporter substrate-binding protein [Gammaproteobacteria bacterium]
MSMKKNLTKVALACGALLSLTTAQAADSLVLRYNQYLPPTHWTQVDGLGHFFTEVEKATEGRVKIQPSAKPLAPPNRNYQAVTSGIADVAWGPHGYTPGAFPLSEMLEFPFDNMDVEKSSAAYWRVFKKYFEPAGMHDDVVTLAVHVTSGGNLHMKDRPISKIGDFKGAKIRVQTQVVSGAFKELGATPIAGSVSELREFLSRGVIDGTALSDEFLTGLKVDQYIHHVTQIPGGLYSNSAFVIINKGKWEKISEADRKAIMDLAGEKLSARMGKLWEENDVKAREALKARLGDDYQVASDELIQGLEKVFAPHREAWFKAAEKAGVNGQEAMDYYQTELKSMQ